jgi:intraflagellar transport protein 56
MIVGARTPRASAAPRAPQEPAVPHAETNEAFLRQSIENRDYSAAATFIEFLRDDLGQPYTKDLALWHGYSLFHLGDYCGAIDVYERLLAREPDDAVLHLYVSSCHFYNRDFEAARAAVDRGPSCDLRTRLIFHIAHQTGDEQRLFQAHSQLVGTLENQLSLAAVHYLRCSYAEAIEIYRRLLQQHADYLAVHVYVAMCLFKLDQFEDSNDAVDRYLAANSDSAVGLNLKACDYLRLFESDIAESQLLQIKKFASAGYSFMNALVAHNLVVFQNGEGGFVELPRLVDVLPEARFNLALLHMRENSPTEAYQLLQKFVPIDTADNILKANVLLAFGQLTNEVSILEEARQIFSQYGDLEVVRDTVPGRQCLATSKFLTQEYNDVLKILQTIEKSVGETDEFNYNKAMTLALLSRWAEAERYFLLVKNTHFTKEIFYASWLCRCYIKNRKPDNAWSLYLEATQTEDAKTLLHVIATDCYQTGAYYYAMRAYDVLAKFEGDAILREGMIASAVGVFRGILSRKEPRDLLADVLSTLGSEPQAADTLKAIQNYIQTSGEFDDARG